MFPTEFPKPLHLSSRPRGARREPIEVLLRWEPMRPVEPGPRGGEKKAWVPGVASRAPADREGSFKVSSPSRGGAVR
jgi:hypothetical protein